MLMMHAIRINRIAAGESIVHFQSDFIASNLGRRSTISGYSDKTSHNSAVAIALGGVLA
jgi:hypothetical protein